MYGNLFYEIIFIESLPGWFSKALSIISKNILYLDFYVHSQKPKYRVKYYNFFAIFLYIGLPAAKPKNINTRNESEGVSLFLCVIFGSLVSV